MIIISCEKNIHEHFMDEALILAQKAAQLDEVPIGALVVDQNGSIIGSGHNEVEKRHSQTAHAEMIALAQAGQSRENWHLEGCWIYVTLEPCAMCMHAILLSRASGIVYGAESKIYGYHLDNGLVLQVYKNNPLTVVKGIRDNEAKGILQNFFKRKRKKENGYDIT